VAGLTAAGLPQHFLYFLPDRQGHGALRGVEDARTGTLAGVLRNELIPFSRMSAQRR
jgi:hypothetical protein